MAQLVFVCNRAKNSTGRKKAFLHLSKKTVSSHLDNTKMPKFKRVCNNPFHKDWSKTDGDKIVNVKARGLMAVANALERYVEAELGKKGWHTINNLCIACLKACTSKRKVTKFFRKGDLEVLKKYHTKPGMKIQSYGKFIGISINIACHSVVKPAPQFSHAIQIFPRL